MKVIYIRPSGTKGYLRVGISEEDGTLSFTVSEREYADAGSLLVGDAVDEDAFATIKIADERYRATSKALRVLSYGDNSEGMLMRKLLSSGISRAVCGEVICEMVRLGYINSKRQLEKLISYEVNVKNTGQMKLIPKLVAKGYKKKEVEEVIDDLLMRCEISFDEAKERLLYGAPEDEIKKILYKNGHTVC